MEIGHDSPYISCLLFHSAVYEHMILEQHNSVENFSVAKSDVYNLKMLQLSVVINCGDEDPFAFQLRLFGKVMSSLI